MMCVRSKRLAAAVVAAAIMVGGAFAQETDSAYVPFVVNVNATVTARQGSVTIPMTVTGGEEKTLALPLSKSDAVRYMGGTQGKMNAPIITGSRGNITLRLPTQSYQNAEVSLYSVNGKRILRGKADAKDAVSSVSRRNVAAGVYMLSVKGNNGTFTTRLTHSGGKMNINVAFGAETLRQLGKSAAAGDWNITVSTASYFDSAYVLGGLVKGTSNPTQTITLRNPRLNASEAMSGKTALQYFTDNEIKAGWNFGNSTDAVKLWETPLIAVETAAGNPLATQALFNGVKESGFDIVRITCTWIGHIGSAPDYTINEARLKRVAEVVGYAKTAGIKAMIINIHHDGNNSQGNNTTWGFVDMPAAVNNPTRKTEIQNQISKVWTQIADYFKNYGDYLIFETLNEVHNGNWGVNAPNNEQDILFDWNQAALSAIRATGGNNATRFVAVPGLGSTEPDIVVAANDRNKLLPNDGENGTSKLIVAVHYYAPPQYTVAGITDQAFQLIHTWGTQAEINSLNHEMELLRTNFIDKGIAVYLGEWGAPTDVRSSMNQTIKDTHLNYIKSVATAARANGVLPIYWDDGGNFKVLERSNGRPKTGLWKDVLDTMMSAINNTTPIQPGTKIITISPNVYDAGDGQGAVAHGYQAKIPLSELLGDAIQVTEGATFTLTYTFTSNVAIDNLQVILADTRPTVSYWAELSGYVDMGAVAVGTPVTNIKTITATATAGDSSDAANQFVFNIGETDSAASAPTLTFTVLTLVED